MLLEERHNDSMYISGDYGMKWTIVNDLDVVFVVVYQRILQLLYLEDLLATVKDVIMLTIILVSLQPNS